MIIKVKFTNKIPLLQFLGDYFLIKILLTKS